MSKNGRAVSIEIRGIESLLKRLEEVADYEKMKRVVSKATQIVNRRVKQLCPSESGHLRNSIKMTVADFGGNIVGIVSTSCEYAGYVEFGTGIRGDGSAHPLTRKLGLAYRQDWAGQQAQPFMYEGFVQSEAKIKALIEDAIKESHV